MNALTVVCQFLAYAALITAAVIAIKGILRGMEIEDARRRELEEDGRR